MTARVKKSTAARARKPTAARSRKTSAAPRPDRKRVTLVAPISDAAEVLVTGDFTDWSTEGVRLKRRRAGHWSATLQLTPGSYEYRLLVDGQWWNNPGCEHRSRNPFGSENDVLIVT